MIDEQETNKQQVILSQWQTCVEMANNISQRRDTTNNVFITLNLAIITAVSSISSIENISKFVILIFGMGICFLWFLLIKNFKTLNKIKFEIINEIEEKLPLQPFKDEWERLNELKNSEEKYKNFTKIESYLPLVFSVLYLIYMFSIISC
ncbi:MAG: hypothetical protein J6M43_09340 [Neisseriaceae bacterium]|nr:hypothetical protein [Neisseriaceae bacterium]